MHIWYSYMKYKPLDVWILCKEDPTVFMGQMPCGILMGTTN